MRRYHYVSSSQLGKEIGFQDSQIGGGCRVCSRDWRLRCRTGLTPATAAVAVVTAAVAAIVMAEAAVGAATMEVVAAITGAAITAVAIITAATGEAAAATGAVAGHPDYYDGPQPYYYGDGPEYSYPPPQGVPLSLTLIARPCPTVVSNLNLGTITRSVSLSILDMRRGVTRSPRLHAGLHSRGPTGSLPS